MLLPLGCVEGSPAGYWRSLICLCSCKCSWVNVAIFLWCAQRPYWLPFRFSDERKDHSDQLLGERNPLSDFPITSSAYTVIKPQRSISRCSAAQLQAFWNWLLTRNCCWKAETILPGIEVNCAGVQSNGITQCLPYLPLESWLLTMSSPRLSISSSVQLSLPFILKKIHREYFLHLTFIYMEMMHKYMNTHIHTVSHCLTTCKHWL